MNDPLQETLCELIATHGVELCDDPRRCEDLLLDALPQQHRRIGVLTRALEQGAADDLLRSRDRSPAVVTRLAQRLRQELGLTEATALWVAETWALALGRAEPRAVLSGASAQSALSPRMLPPSSEPGPTSFRAADALAREGDVAAPPASLAPSLPPRQSLPRALGLSVLGAAFGGFLGLMLGAVHAGVLGGTQGHLGPALLGGWLVGVLVGAVVAPLRGAASGAWSGALVVALVAILNAAPDILGAHPPADAAAYLLGYGVGGGLLGLFVALIAGALYTVLWSDAGAAGPWLAGGVIGCLLGAVLGFYAGNLDNGPSAAVIHDLFSGQERAALGAIVGLLVGLLAAALSGGTPQEGPPETPV